VGTVPYEAPVFSDLQIELLRRLAEGHALTEALDEPEPLPGVTMATAKPAVEKATNDLGRFMGATVPLVKAKGRTGTFATAECQELAPALTSIADNRDATKETERRQRELEALQLATCLDKEPLKIGTYPAHAERFLATAAQLMADYFPWVESRIIVVHNRARFNKAQGEVRIKYNNREFDAMLVPRDSEQGHLDYVYTYSFRVVGSRQKTQELRDEHNVIDRFKLKDEQLLVGPKDSSSRRRLRQLLLDIDIDIESNPDALIEDDDPSSMRMRAETGEGLAVMSDEYKTVGTCRKDFPYLGLGQVDGHQEIHKVEMGLLMGGGNDEPRHRAFRFVVRELVTLEHVRARAAVQD
jgi:hypothetical protein